MKKLKFSSLLVGVGLVSSTVFAVQQLSGEITEDLDFPGGVLLTNTTLPNDQNATTGTSTVKLEGTGSITVSSRKTGGFPKVRVAGGTTISSSRVFEKTDMKSWWEGQFEAPSSTKSPAAADIEFDAIKNSKDSKQVVETFSWGLGNEEFSFSSAAQVLFPVDEVDNVILYPAYFEGGKWTVRSEESCVVEDNLCYLEISKMNGLALVKRLYESCPQGIVKNGKRGSTPNCTLTCNSGYKISNDGSSCESIAGNSSEGENTSEKSQNLLTANNSQNSNETKTYKYREGYFRYIGARNHRQRKLDESGVTGDKLDEIQHLNKSYLMRHPRSAESQIKKEKTEKKDDEGFMSYLLEMRNAFGEGSNGNGFVASNTEDESVDNSEEGELLNNNESNDNSTYHSSGLLPSTGPELFVIIAILGLILMLFGAKRRN